MSEVKETVKNDKTQPRKHNAFVRFFIRMGSGIKKGFSNMFQELKKVSWPKFGTVVKQTGVVLGVVLLFLVVVTGFDALLGFVLKLVTGAQV